MTDAIVRAWREGDDERLVPLWEPMGWAPLEVYRRKFDDSSNDRNRVWVVELAGEIVGHAIATRRDVFVEGAWHTFGGVGHLVVHPKARGLGLGWRLLRLCEQAASEAGLRGILMWTQETLVPAYSLYVRDGFELVAQTARHQVMLQWLAEVTPGRALAVRPIDPTAPDVLDLRREWAQEAFPVSTGWDVTCMAGTDLGIFEGDDLVGAFASGLGDPVVRAQRVGEALGAMARWKLEQGARVAEFRLSAGSPADTWLAPYTNCREETGLRTMVKPLGEPLVLGTQYLVHGACWPW